MAAADIKVDVRNLAATLDFRIKVIGGKRTAFRFRAMRALIEIAARVGGIRSLEIADDGSGVIRAGTAEAADIKRVLIDGAVVERVAACLPGEHGWLDRYTGEVAEGQALMERRYGRVVVEREKPPA